MFSPVQNKRVYEHVVDQIQKQIFNGELSKGDKLPPERELTTQLGVSRTSVREALRALEVTGLIESRQGEGNFISGTLENTLLEPLTAMFMLNKGKPRDILELRTILEVKAAELAALRISDLQSIELEHLLNELSDATLEARKSELDTQLHYYIGEITGNVLISNILNIISTMMEMFVQTSRRKILENPNNQELLFKHHEDIVKAIISKDPEKAKAAMLAHMTMVDDIVHP